MYFNFFHIFSPKLFSNKIHKMEEEKQSHNKAIVTRSNSNASSSRHLASVGNYNFEEGKIRASLKWLVSRIFADGYVPDGLRELFHTDAEGHLQVSPPLVACLANGSFYCQAASRIFRDNALVNSQQNIGAVFAALSQVGIDVRDSDGNSVTEQALLQSDPFNISVHLHMIDALMTAHLRSLVSIEKVVQAISNYTSIEKREEPLDCVDALLFWINKVCLLVRDDVERNGMPDEAAEPPIIPEMEDLYEDLCDGTCICALLSFYRPNEVFLQEICFNDPMSVNDCRFNLGILSKFCATCLPWSPFHFDPDDILYLHESLQPNINAFLADLFQFFEGPSLAPPEPTPVPEQHHRRFVPVVQPIPDLRGQDTAKMGIFGGAKTAGMRQMGGATTSKRDRASSMASEDSLATLRTKDSLTVSTPRPNNLDPNAPNVTHFVAFRPQDQNQQQPQMTGPSQQQSHKGMAELRLQMEEMRRQLSQRQQMEIAQREQRRNEASKDAFFKVMSKSANNELNPQVLQSPPEAPATNLSRSQDTDALAAQFQQMATHFGSQLSMAPDPHRTPQHQQQQYRQMLPNQQLFPHAQQQTSTPQSNLSFGGTMPMVSPIGPPPSQQQQPTSFDPSSQQLFSNSAVPQFMAPPPQQGQQQYFAQPPPPQQQMVPDQQQSPYAVPNGMLNHHHHQQQFVPAPSSSYGFGFGSSFPSSSQPSHLHMIHQQHPQQQHPQFFTPQYQSQLQHQFPQQQPYYQTQQSVQNYAPADAMVGFPSSQQQQPQHYVPSPLPPPINTATMFPVNDQQQQMIGHRLFMDNQLVNQQQQQLAEEQQQQHSAGGGTGGTFRLHQANAPISRLDPQLDLNRSGELTNWGQMTYRAGDRPQRKTWAQKQAEGAAVGTMPNLSAGGGSVLQLGSPEGDQRNLLDRTIGMKENELAANSALLSPLAGGANNNSSSSPSNNSNLNRSGGVAIADVSDPNCEMTPEMHAKRQAILANQIRRKERILAKSEEKESEEQDRMQVKMQLMEQAEQRKLEKEQRRQKLLENYKRKKMEQELGAAEPMSARMCTSSTISLNNRGHSQPPFGRPKSQSNMNLVGAVSHGVGGTLNRRLNRAQSNVGGGVDENGTPRISVPSIAEPSLKLYAKHQPKSNRSLIMNALQYSVFPGHVSNDQRQKAQTAIAQSNSKHFLVLFRDHKCQYRGLYTWDQFSDTAHKIEGLGPKVCKEVMMIIMYKYDSGAKSFSQIPTKHLSATIDGFVIADQYWQKPKIPHSGR